MMNFIFQKGGKLFIYNASRNHILGTYTEKTNILNKEFATQFVAEDKLILEYAEPINNKVTDLPRIIISGIGYGYNYLNIINTLNNDIPDPQPGGSGWCMVNINCPEGVDWQDQKKELHIL